MSMVSQAVLQSDIDGMVEVSVGSNTVSRVEMAAKERLEAIELVGLHASAVGQISVSAGARIWLTVEVSS